LNILNFLKHPLTLGLDLDDPKTTLLRREIIRGKPFLRKIYQDWYGWIAANIPPGEGRVLELGSGAGFLAEFVSGLITSEVFVCPHVNMIMDGCSMPFCDNSLKAIVMIDVFHHIPHAESFLREATRCLRPGGKVLMVEPWATPWSSIVYSRLHYEPFDAKATQWSFPSSGPLSGSNNALPWIVFERDRRRYETLFPHLPIEAITIEKPFVYLLSGGVSMRNLMPGGSYIFWKKIESLLSGRMQTFGMFACIELVRREQA
jgi:SAM-dependent methyltransferase